MHTHIPGDWALLLVYMYLYSYIIIRWCQYCVTGTVCACWSVHWATVASTKTVVERREVGSVMSAGKLQNLYPRVCVILEEPAAKEGRKAWSVKILLLVSWRTTCSSSLPRSKPSHYVETSVSRLLSAGVHVLFSQSQSSLLATLGSSEAVRGHTLSLTEQHTQAD